MSFLVFSNTLHFQNAKAVDQIFQYDIVDCNGGDICVKDYQTNQVISISSISYSGDNVHISEYSITYNVFAGEILYLNYMTCPANNDHRSLMISKGSGHGYSEIHFYCRQTPTGSYDYYLGGADSVIIENESVMNATFNISSYDTNVITYDTNVINKGFLKELSCRGLCNITNYGTIESLSIPYYRADEVSTSITNEPNGTILNLENNSNKIVTIVNKGSITGSIVSVDSPNFSYESQGGTCGSITVGSTIYPPGTATVGPPISPSGSLSPSGSTPSGGSSSATIDKKKESDKIIKDFDKFMKAKPSKTKIEKTTASYIAKIYKLWPNNANSTTYIKKLINTGVKYLKQLSKNNRLSKQKAFILKVLKSVKLDKAVPSKLKGKTLTKAQKTKWKNDRIKSVKKTIAKYSIPKLKKADRNDVKKYIINNTKISF